MPGSLGTWVCLGSPHPLCRPCHPPERLLEDLQLLVLLLHQAGHLYHLVLEHAQLTALLLDQCHVPLQFYLLLFVQFPWRGGTCKLLGVGSPALGLLEGHSRSARPPRTTRQFTLQEFSGGFSNSQEVCLQKKKKQRNRPPASPFNARRRREAACVAPAWPQLSGPVCLWHFRASSAACFCICLPKASEPSGDSSAHVSARGNSLQPRPGGDRLEHTAQPSPCPGGIWRAVTTLLPSIPTPWQN